MGDCGSLGTNVDYANAAPEENRTDDCLDWACGNRRVTERRAAGLHLPQSSEGPRDRWPARRPGVEVRAGCHAGYPVKGGKCAQTTTARMCWDDKRLYVAFDCADKDILATMTKRDELLFHEEVVEVFLEPSGDLKRYFEIEVSPRNVIFDATIINTSGHCPGRNERFRLELQGIAHGGCG